MPLRLRIRNWKIRLISWIKKSDYYYPAKSNLIQQVEKYSCAIPNYERAKELHEKQKASPLTIKERKELTKRLRKFDQYEDHELDEIKDVFRLKTTKKLLLTSWELMDSKMAITSFHSIGTCYYDLGFLNRAKKYEEKALLLAKNNYENNITKAMIYNGLGIIQRRMHNYDKALMNFKIGLNICEEVGNDNDKATYLNHIVDCLILLENLTEAMKKLKRAKRLDKKSGSLRGKGYRLNNMARIHWINKNFSKAIDLLMKSLYIAIGLKDKRNILERTINIGNVYSEQNNIYKAAKYYLKSLNLIDQIHYPDGEYEVQNNLGIFYGKKLGDPLYSLFSLEEAFAILKKLKRSRSPSAILIKSDIIRLREILQNIGFNLVVLDDFSLILGYAN